MSQPVRSSAPIFTQVDISPGSPPSSSPVTGTQHEQNMLLRDMLQALDRQNELMEELVVQVGRHHKERHAEISQWKEAHPKLAKQCHVAAEMLAKVQTEYLATMVGEINENSDGLMDGEFLLNEFVDRYGPRLAQLNGVLQVLGQLGSESGAAKA